jgi:hypothetical protein
VGLLEGVLIGVCLSAIKLVYRFSHLSIRLETEDVHLEGLSYIDHACLDLFMTWEKQHEALGGRLVIDWDDLHVRFHEGPNGGKVAAQLPAGAEPNSK